jgi:N-methylhydantoinase B
MAYTIIQTAHSEIVRDVMDFSTACCDATGRLIAQGNTIAMHLGSVPEAMEALRLRFADDVHLGDVFVLNDPYEGGMHLPDVYVIKPVFATGVLAGWSIAIAHQTDMGGRVPGSNASDSTEIFQEGLRIPPLKLYDRGVRDETLISILRKNVRVPGRVLGDWAAQLSACEIGERGIQALVERYGLTALNAYIEQLHDYSEAVLRAEIARWPDGEYRFIDYVDDDGFGNGPLPINVTLVVRGTDLTVDYTGTAQQAQGAINSTLSFTKSCTYLSVRCMLADDIPNNAGFFRPITVVAPSGTIVNLTEPAACAARALTGYRIVDAMFGALAQILPERVPAAGEGGNTVVCLSGRHSDGRPYIIVDMLCGAWGGRQEKDGVDAVTNPAQNLSNTPVEVLEAAHPIVIERYALVTDSCGAGRHRGGLAIERHYRILRDDTLLQLRSDRWRTPPWGLGGGGDGTLAANVLTRDGRDAPLPGKVTMQLRRDDLICHRMAGAGGHGDPLQRAAGNVLDDVLDGRITPESARREHGVVLTDTGDVDVDATRVERSRRAGVPDGVADAGTDGTRG